MTCYFRPLEGFFKKAEITVTSRNRKDIDMIIHKMAGVNYKSCALTWKQVKNLLREDEACFIADLKRRWTETKPTVDIP